jgi:hypothetical protein
VSECVAAIESGHGHNISQLTETSPSSSSSSASVLTSGQDGCVYKWRFPPHSSSTNEDPQQQQQPLTTRRLLHAAPCGFPLTTSSSSFHVPCRDQILGVSTD